MIGQYRHLVTLEAPGTPVADPDGGWTDTWAPLDPATWHCAILPATVRDLESIGAGTVLAQATHVVKGRYHPGLTTQSRLRWDEVDETGTIVTEHVLSVVFVANRDQRRIESDLVCAEVVA